MRYGIGEMIIQRMDNSHEESIWKNDLSRRIGRHGMAQEMPGIWDMIIGLMEGMPTLVESETLTMIMKTIPRAGEKQGRLKVEADDVIKQAGLNEQWAKLMKHIGVKAAIEMIRGLSPRGPFIPRMLMLTWALVRGHRVMSILGPPGTAKSVTELMNAMIIHATARDTKGKSRT